MGLSEPMLRALFFLNYRYKSRGTCYRLFSEQKENQYRPEGELEMIQFSRLKAIVEHAYDNVEFYRRAFDKAKVKPSDIKKLSDIGRLPVISKKELRKFSIEERTA